MMTIFFWAHAQSFYKLMLMGCIVLFHQLRLHLVSATIIRLLASLSVSLMGWCVSIWLPKVRLGLLRVKSRTHLFILY